MYGILIRPFLWLLYDIITAQRASDRGYPPQEIPLSALQSNSRSMETSNDTSGALTIKIYLAHFMNWLGEFSSAEYVLEMILYGPRYFKSHVPERPKFETIWLKKNEIKQGTYNHTYTLWSHIKAWNYQRNQQKTSFLRLYLAWSL
jgi:hypothetical protein